MWNGIAITGNTGLSRVSKWDPSAANGRSALEHPSPPENVAGEGEEGDQESIPDSTGSETVKFTRALVVPYAA
jgi:hypothetical protein